MIWMPFFKIRACVHMHVYYMYIQLHCVIMSACIHVCMRVCISSTYLQDLIPGLQPTVFVGRSVLEDLLHYDAHLQMKHRSDNR